MDRLTRKIVLRLGGLHLSIHICIMGLEKMMDQPALANNEMEASVPWKISGLTYLKWWDCSIDARYGNQKEPDVY